MKENYYAYFLSLLYVFFMLFLPFHILIFLLKSTEFKMKNFTKLYGFLKDYPDELGEYILLSNSYHFFELFKIAQQLDGKNMFGEIDREEEEEISFSSTANSLGLSEEVAKKMDLILERLKESNPYVSTKMLYEDVKKDFIGSSPSFGSVRYTDFFDRSPALKKYLKLFPDLKWKPEFYQVPLPFDDAFGVGPLGQPAAKVLSNHDKLKEAYDIIISNPEAKAIADKMWKDKGTADAPYSYYRIKDNFIINLLKEKGFDDSLDMYDLKEFYRTDGASYSSISKPILKKDIDDYKVKIEKLWRELKSLHLEAMTIKETINPGEFIPKQESEIVNFQDSFISAAKYSIFIVKKLSYDNLDIEPFKYFSSTRNNKKSIDDIKKILEEETLDSNPISDAISKIHIIKSEIQRTESIIYNAKKYAGIFRRLDKNLIDECLKRLNLMSDEDKKLIKWIDKYRIDIIQKNYSMSLKMIASDVASEAEKYKDIEYNINISANGIRNILYFEAKNQSQLINSLVGLISKQVNYIGDYVIKNIIEKSKLLLFNKAKELFDNAYFEFPFYAPSLFGSNTFYLINKEILFEYDKIIKFINEYNGKPNIKSYLNVFFNISKNKELLDKYLKTVLKEDIFGSSSPNFKFDIDKKILNIINNSKIKDEEKLINFITDNLTEDSFDILKKYIADRIFFKFSNKELLSNSYNEINLYSNKANKIAPTASSKLFKDMIISSNTDSPFSNFTTMTPSLSLYRIMNKLKTLFANKDSVFSNYELADNILEEIDKNGENNKFKAINNILDRISVELSAGNVSLPEYITRYDNNIVKLPILKGSTFEFKFGKDVGKVCKVLNREKFNKIEYLTPDGNIETISFDDIYRSIHVLSPTLQDFYNSISSLKQKNNIPNFEIPNGESYYDTVDKIKLLLEEMNIEWNGVYQDQVEINIYKDIIFRYNINFYSKENFVETIRRAAKEIAEVEAIDSFTRRSSLLAETFGSIGFKDISLSIDNILSRNKIDFLPKKEIVSKILSLVNDSFKPNNEETKYIVSFLRSIKEGMFDNYIVPIIKKLNIVNFTIITKICHQVMNSQSNFYKEELNRALKILKLEGMDVFPAVERIINASSYLHNNAALPEKYARTMIRSPNFYSDSQISREYIESCTKLFMYGGIESFYNENSNTYKIVQKMVLARLIENVDDFKNILNSFSKLCMNKDGIRTNLGNPTADIKLDNLLNKIVNENNLDEDQAINLNMSNYIPAWESLSFDGKIEKLKEHINISSLSNDISNDTIIKTLRNYIYGNNFEKEIENIRKSASDRKQYLKDIKIKEIIQKASSYLKMLETSSTIIEFAMLAKKKDERLFNFEYTHNDNSFRFRVLRDMDPQHLTIGADTNCCQRINGIGHNSAVDSYINPLAGVLLLEGKINEKWNIISQSYFHYVPKNNGLILDNVEFNPSNTYAFFKGKSYNLEYAYAIFSSFIKDKYNLSYVVCGMKFNKLNNSMFSKSRLDGDDPRHFEFKKYSDFKMSRHLNLLSPKFKLDI